MCYVHLHETQMEQSKELDFESWKKIIDDAIAAGMVFASLSGGECLTVPFFDELYLYLKERGILVFVLTNGFLLSEKESLFLKHPPAHIQVSVYGYDEDSYYAVTGVRAYKRVDDAIQKLHQAGISLSVAITASKYLPSVYKIVRHFYKLGIGATVNKWLLPPYSSTGRNLEQFDLSVKEQIKIEREIKRATEQTEPIEKHGKLPEPGGPCKEICYGLTCAAGRTDFSVNWKGKLLPCVSLPESMGRPLTDGFLPCWKKAVKYADTRMQPKECFDCRYHAICRRCYAFHLMGGGEGHCNQRACEEVMLMVQQGLAELPPEV